MKRKILLVLIVLAVLIVPSGAAAAYYLWNMPLGAHLALPEEPAAYLASYPAAAQVQSKLEPSRKSPGKKIAQGTCDGKGVMAVQLLGLNRPASPRGTDAIRLLKVDYEAGTVTILAVPPELWVQTPDLRNQGITEDMLTMVYLHALKVSPGSGREKVFQATHSFSKTLRDNFGYWPDRYVTLNQPAFEGMIDELDGIDVDMPGEVGGTQHFDGQQALDYVRLLLPSETEWERLHRQDQVLKAILHALYNNWTKVPAVVAQFKDAVATDLSAKQINSLMCMIEAAGDEAVYREITSDMIPADGEGHRIPIAELVVPLFEQLSRK
jgi:anionic cell wall polymer biosynthesis LytR-Cps2A-Psr (LCP) family protein